jgi:hypothetical protein
LDLLKGRIDPGFIATPLNADTRAGKAELVQTLLDHNPARADRICR